MHNRIIVHIYNRTYIIIYKRALLHRTRIYLLLYVLYVHVRRRRRGRSSGGAGFSLYLSLSVSLPALLLITLMHARSLFDFSRRRRFFFFFSPGYFASLDNPRRRPSNYRTLAFSRPPSRRNSNPLKNDLLSAARARARSHIRVSRPPVRLPASCSRPVRPIPIHRARVPLKKYNNNDNIVYIVLYVSFSPRARRPAANYYPRPETRLPAALPRRVSHPEPDRSSSD